MNVSTTMLAFLGTQDLLIVAFICLLLFGAKRLPELFRSLGQSVKEFKRASSDVEDNFRMSLQDEERKKIQDEERKRILDEERQRIRDEERRRMAASTTPVAAGSADVRGSDQKN
jgi:sec-independent protein translocase protein TatA